MIRRVIAIAAAALIARVAQAQTTTADGVDAFLRGDYPRAAEIFVPLVSPLRPPDHAAEFFLAAMYENGLGVPVDPMRACALYSRASIDDTGLFGSQAALLLQAASQALGPAGFSECVFLSTVGFDHGLEKTTFQLGPGHWIMWDLTGATVAFDGKERHTNTGLALPGSIFLPLQHVQLMTGPDRQQRRDFVEAFVWHPTVDVRTWSLECRLYEVVRADVVAVGRETLSTASGSRPPSRLPFDLNDVVQLRVNDNGEVEWEAAGTSGTHAMVVESPEAREAGRAREAARAEADKHVPWDRESDPNRRPSLEYADADGCASIFVYAWTAERAEAIAIRADQSLLQLSTEARTFDLAAPQAGLEVTLHVYERALRQWPFCTDVVIGSGAAEVTWRATRGTLSIELPQPTRATIQIRGAEFVNDSGMRVQQIRPITLTANVGRMFGE